MNNETIVPEVQPIVFDQEPPIDQPPVHSNIPQVNSPAESQVIAEQQDQEDKKEEEVKPEVQEKRVPAEKDANVCLGKDGEAMPEGHCNIGMITVMMPDEAQQRAGWKIDKESVGPFIAQYPQYKYFTDKGQSPV